MSGLRERKKAQTRQALADAALRLFLERGYDAVSLKEIAEAADVSVPTVFAHFPDGKESLVFDLDADRERQLVAAVRDRAPGSGVLDGLLEMYLAGPLTGESAEMRDFLRLIESTPALREYSRRMWQRHEGALAGALAAELGVPPGDPAATALAHFALGAVQVARAADDPAAAVTRIFELLESGWGPLLSGQRGR
ncbi:TetR/AcrR family transcriptional regulator [Nocardia terpenica]|uniref:TetR family transcriptional regulator n=1 Tax=Nocardia terpenica TaxID=455432 RepID=A0A161WD38_9NOCA|nr:helix-turn-helix domain-containing protein [Nocardia terpenica]KZM74889.1 TetR family transcriptional regulator [Nocardia terpenica]NQE93456.1 TetR family transcriptional regulator [Nocardia terpenica]